MINNDENILSQLNLERSELIGVGMFGRVYKAYEKKTCKVFCVKIIPKDKFRREEFEISEKLKKSENISKDNENLIIYSDKKEFKEFNIVTLIMEFMNGGDLKSYVDNHEGYFSPKEIFNLIKQICLNFLFYFYKI
jgi:serine/threonine protein kinase